MQIWLPTFGQQLKYSQISSVFVLALIVNVVGIVLALFVNFRYSAVFSVHRKLSSQIVLDTE
ncbi:hypothetical protein [Paenibacillus farraposensis]|uniref:hypothetical protein n=1 Tax=Paenibacillus farraposensis TaxID=2807095 RepID=UPI001E5CEE3B|nr:hypothetical protein [Paenibacillus farraposensis]